MKDRVRWEKSSRKHANSDSRTIFSRSAPEKERVGNLIDFWFEPSPTWKLTPMNSEKERIKELCEPVYKWVALMK